MGAAGVVAAPTQLSPIIANFTPLFLLFSYASLRWACV